MEPHTKTWILWILACMIGEAFGIMGISTTYAAIDRNLLPFPNASIIAAGAFEGGCLGVAQAYVLRRTNINGVLWIIMTVAGAIIGYALSLLGGAGVSQSEPAMVEPALWVIIWMSAALGSLMGALMGFMQAIAGAPLLAIKRWILINAAAWTIAMMVIMAAASTVPPQWSLLKIAILGLAAGAIAGVALGGITGWELSRSVKTPTEN